jgi:UDP-glucose 4-epimerase
MRILVTGAAGFIGATTAELMLSRGHDVVALDNLVAGRRENVPGGATFVEGDCGDMALVSSLGDFDACVHFAGLIEPRVSMEQPERFFENNVASSLRLLEVLIQRGVGRFVFSSSCAVYGDQLEMPITEDRPINPLSPYGQSKRMVEEAMTWLSRLGRIRTASLRYFNAAGGTLAHPERHDPETHLIPLALDVAAGRRDYLEIYGTDYPTPDGTCIRDYIHVSDLAEAHLLAIEALAEHGELTLNLGSAVGSSNRQVVDAVRHVTGMDLDVRYVAPRPGDPASAIASNDKAREVLHWQPRHSELEKIVADAWAARSAWSKDRA